MVLSAPRNRDLALLGARSVGPDGGIAPSTGRSILDAIRVSVRQAPLLAADLRLLTARLDDGWTIEQALCLADDLDSPDADAVLAAWRSQPTVDEASATVAAGDNIDRVELCGRSRPTGETENRGPSSDRRDGGGVGISSAVRRLLLRAVRRAGQLLLAALVTAYLGSLLFLPAHAARPGPTS